DLGDAQRRTAVLLRLEQSAGRQGDGRQDEDVLAGLLGHGRSSERCAGAPTVGRRRKEWITDGGPPRLSARRAPRTAARSRPCTAGAGGRSWWWGRRSSPATGRSS